MFSINDTIDTEESVEIQVKNYAEIGHTHEIKDINNLQAIIDDLQKRIEQLETAFSELQAKINLSVK